MKDSNEAEQLEQIKMGCVLMNGMIIPIQESVSELRSILSSKNHLLELTSEYGHKILVPKFQLAYFDRIKAQSNIQPIKQMPRMVRS